MSWDFSSVSMKKSQCLCPCSSLQLKHSCADVRDSGRQSFSPSWTDCRVPNVGFFVWLFFWGRGNGLWQGAEEVLCLIKILLISIQMCSEGFKADSLIREFSLERKVQAVCQQPYQGTAFTSALEGSRCSVLLSQQEVCIQTQQMDAKPCF